MAMGDREFRVGGAVPESPLHSRAWHRTWRVLGSARIAQ